VVKYIQLGREGDGLENPRSNCTDGLQEISQEMARIAGSNHTNQRILQKVMTF
jgi:hypothetical protein